MRKTMTTSDQNETRKAMPLTDYQAKYLAHELTRRHGAGDASRLTGALADALVDLNPHQIDAALFAFRSPVSQGVLIADEVGLGKTIEAGLVLAQLWAERRGRLVVIVPANLRTQWLQELTEKFFLPCRLLETRSYNAHRRDQGGNPFLCDEVIITSYQFARGKAPDLRGVPWDLVVMDEAHRLRNVYKPGSRIARDLRDALAGRRKLLLTATPLQNNLVELYGLISFIDEHAFADPKSFQEQYGGKRGADQFAELKDRLKPLCQRTLRRQVTPYIQYTKRHPILQEFSPSEDESTLYDMVSDYLQRDDLRALPTSQRALMTMVFRKLLASSTYAIAGALDTLTRRLTADLATASPSPHLSIAEVIGDDYDTLDETADEWSPDDAPAPERSPIDQALLRQEVAELSSFRDLALSIRDNAKGEALLIALETGFSHAERLGAPRKAIIFTESRRTQEYLVGLLEEAGLGDKIVLFNGSNSDHRSRTIYEAWRRRHTGTDRVTGSRTADMRSALVDYFRDEGRIMIATEAGAEGINLQFCSLVVNYDLPWNPQRIEQRIGRCHRYGQKHDVVVINFLNQDNEADRRVYELLDQKFELFSGVFGASDEVLGSMGSGVDFERRIGDIYQTCRLPQEIAAAFDALQQDMSVEITAEILRTRESLLEHFDEEVNERLRLHEDASAAVSRLEQLLMRLTRHELRESATFTDDRHFHLERMAAYLNGAHGTIPTGSYAIGRSANPDIEHVYRLGSPLAQSVLAAARDRPLPVATVTFDYGSHGARITDIQRLVGRQGWLQATRLTLAGGQEMEDSLLLAATTDDGTPIDSEIAVRLLTIPAVVTTTATDLPATDLSRLTQQTEALAGQEIANAADRNHAVFLQEIEKMDAWANDRRLALRVSVKDLEDEQAAIRKQLRQGADMAQLLTLKHRQNQIQERIEERESEIRTEARKIRAEADALLNDIEARLKNTESREPLFTIRWRVV